MARPALSGLLARPALATPAPASLLLSLAARPFSTTPAPQKEAKKKGKKAGASGAENRPKVQLLRGNLHGFAPPPLRMARNRHLRHWTIHRAWLLHQRKTREARDRELMRMHQGMHNACEELRITEGPGLNGEGYLYRVAMEKKGLYNLGAIPIELAKMQTETPARVAWNHDWKR